MCLVGRYYLTDREKSPTFFLLGRAKKLPWTPRVFSISSAWRPVISLWNHLQIYTGIKTKQKKYCMKTASITHTYFKQTNRNTRLHTHVTTRSYVLQTCRGLFVNVKLYKSFGRLNFFLKYSNSLL